MDKHFRKNTMSFYTFSKLNSWFSHPEPQYSHGNIAILAFDIKIKPLKKSKKQKKLPSNLVLYT